MSKHISYKPTSASQIVYDARNLVILKSLKRLGIRPDSKVLDVGCWRGDMLKLLRKEGYSNLFGLDIDSQCVLASSEYGEVCQGGVEALAHLFPGIEFDAIICSHVLKHVANPLEALRSIGVDRGGSFLLPFRAFSL